MTHELRDLGQETGWDKATRPADLARPLHSVSDIDPTRAESTTVIDIRSGDVTVEIGHSTLEGALRILNSERGLLHASALSRATKRALDLIGALAILVISAPVLVAIAAAVKVSSPGPVLYVSDRVGKDGDVFRFYKFRSMKNGADKVKSELEDHNEVTGPVFKMRRDPRVTPVGRFIRKFSIDELPQLLNVINGDMSLVGPRPPTVDEVELYNEQEAQRLLVRPGLTCIWQVSGRSEIGFDEWVALDLEYIERWSLLLDLKLLLATVPAVFSGRGAY